MKPAISVIIPVYNAEQYLRRCLDSIRSQTFKDFEVVCIDDGSPDRSGEILDEYARVDNRFKIIHQKNSGVSAARQKGLDTVIGDYVITADPDDWVDPDWLEVLYSEAERSKVDIACCDFIREYKDYSIYASTKPTSYNKDDLLKDILSGKKVWGETVTKLVKRSFITQNDITYDIKQNLGEDLLFVTKLIICGASFVHIDKGLYHYDRFSNASSLTRKCTPKQVESLKIYIDYVIDKLGGEDEYMKYIYTRKLQVKCMALACGKEHNELLINTYQEINENIIRDYSGAFFRNPKLFCVTLCIKNHPFMGHCVFNIYSRIFMPLKKYIRTFCR